VKFMVRPGVLGSGWFCPVAVGSGRLSYGNVRQGKQPLS
jgi:hypothetical protein